MVENKPEQQTTSVPTQGDSLQTQECLTRVQLRVLQMPGAKVGEMNSLPDCDIHSTRYAAALEHFNGE